MIKRFVLSIVECFVSFLLVSLKSFYQEANCRNIKTDLYGRPEKIPEVFPPKKVM